MEARKKVARLGPCTDEVLRQRVERLARRNPGPGRLADVLDKDLHLIEPAMAADTIIVSLDEIAKGAFRLAAGSIRELRAVAWINPDDASGEVMAWLASGTDAHDAWLLGSE